MDVLLEYGLEITTAARRWQEQWPRGIILRSSAVTETLRDRGSYLSRRLAGDFSAEQVTEELRAIFEGFEQASEPEGVAILIQPLVGAGALGNFSNERRISATKNHWGCEQTFPTLAYTRLNSQTDSVPDKSIGLTFSKERDRVRLFGGIGRWVNSLGAGPAHLEWAIHDNRIWLLQLDFEDDSPDDGVVPDEVFHPSPERPPSTEHLRHFEKVVFSAKKFPWKKIENTRAFLSEGRPFLPDLYTINGTTLWKPQHRSELIQDLEEIGRGRVVCRTDCLSLQVRGLNLPRTFTVDSETALEQMLSFARILTGKGARLFEICFIVHRFIPSKACAWVCASPSDYKVRVDSLWGVPDGLQYLPHDTFEIDVRKGEQLSGRFRYKPRFIQEAESGRWEDYRVRRTVARHRSLEARDAKQIATESYEIAQQVGEPVLIMWFCGVPTELGHGRNLPWFRMPPHKDSIFQGNIIHSSIAPKYKKRYIRNEKDIDIARGEGLTYAILVLEPELYFIRNEDKFLDKVVSLASEFNLPVQLSGSVLSHAFYQLEKSGVTVIVDEPAHTRTRAKKTFQKIVRDRIPENIERSGETVVRGTVARGELRPALVSKLFEEAHELLAARDPDEVKGELCDLFEVIRSLASVTGVEWNDVVRTADTKRAERGGFEHGAVLLETSRPASGQQSTRELSSVPLSRIAPVRTASYENTIPYSRVVASLGNARGVVVQVRGTPIRVSIGGDGIKLSPATSDESDPQEQLVLDL